MTLVDNAAFQYRGTVFIGSGREVFANGFSLNFARLATRSDWRHVSSIRRPFYQHWRRCRRTRWRRFDAETAGARALPLEATSTTMLTGNLRLDTNTVIQAGATFSGGGSLIVGNGGGGLFPDDASNINVRIDNRGEFAVAGVGIGVADVKDFRQAANGEMHVGLSGIGLTQFDQLEVSGAAQLDGALELLLVGGFMPSFGQTFNILSAAGGVSGTFASVLDPAGMPPGLGFELIYLPTLVQLRVGGTVNDTWDNSSASALWGDDTNWLDDTKPTFASDVTFPAGFPNGDTTVTLPLDESARSLTFNDSYTLSGGSINLGGAGSITVAATKTAVITSTMLLPGGLAKAGDGSLVVNHVRFGPLSLNGGAVAIAPNGGDGGASVVSTLTIGATSKLDLNDNDLVVRAAAATKDAVHANVQAKIISAQNGLDANFITNWNGPGITSSAARNANVGGGFDLVGLGVIRNSDIDIITGLPGASYTTFSGQSVTPDDILVKYTYIGDGNLDGLVSFDDYVGMDNAFFGLIPNLGWATGDINFDGVINFDDYTVVDQAFFFQGTPLGSGDAVAAVPEPRTWLLVVVGLLIGISMWKGGQYRHGAVSQSG